jgi:hypothetical protein
MTNDEILKLLHCIRNLALIPYPYLDKSSNEGEMKLAFALGQIGGIATKAITEYNKMIESEAGNA